MTFSWGRMVVGSLLFLLVILVAGYFTSSQLVAVSDVIVLTQNRSADPSTTNNSHLGLNNISYLDHHTAPTQDNSFKVSDAYHNMTKILLLTYYRGGSSFLGQMFGQNQRAFYWFEPLDSEQLTMHGRNLKLQHMTIVGTDFQLFPNNSIGPLPHDMLAERTGTLTNTFTCNATNLPRKVLAGKFFRTGQGMPRFKSYGKCLRDTKHDFIGCAKVLQSTCFDSELVAAKVIRYPMYEVGQLIRLIPDLKVIHYVRDPRGIMASRSRIHAYYGKRLLSQAAQLCMELEHNHRQFQALRALRPTNHLLLKYEDLALKPEETAEGLYQFLGHKMPTNLYSWIDKNTNAKASDWAYGTRRNSKQIVGKWRKELRGNDLVVVTNRCKSAMKALGYT